jgi:hypothetical protein
MAFSGAAAVFISYCTAWTVRTTSSTTFVRPLFPLVVLVSKLTSALIHSPWSAPSTSSRLPRRVSSSSVTQLRLPMLLQSLSDFSPVLSCVRLLFSVWHVLRLEPALTYVLANSTRLRNLLNRQRPRTVRFLLPPFPLSFLSLIPLSHLSTRRAAQADEGLTHLLPLAHQPAENGNVELGKR